MMYTQAPDRALDLPSGFCPQCPEIEKELRTCVENSVCLTENIMAPGEYSVPRKRNVLLEKKLEFALQEF